MNMFETNEKSRLSKEIENIKKKLMEISELKNTLTKIKNSSEGLNSKMEMTGKIISES